MALVISEREILFCQNYVKTGKKSQSAREAGFTKSPGTIAGRLLKRADIAEYVQSLIDERERLRKEELQLKRATAPGVIAELTKIAFFDLSEVTEVLADSNVLEQDNWSEKARSAISSIKVTRSFTGTEERGDRLFNVTTEIRTYDRIRALKLLGDHTGAFTDLNTAIAVLKTYGIELAKVDGHWTVLEDADGSA